MTTSTESTRPARANRLDLAGLGMTTSVVIPTYNEALNLPWVLERLPEGLHEVLLVDGGSSDGTVEVARRMLPSIKVLGQHAPGKGAALAAGLLAATGEAVVMIDADGSMDPAEIPTLVAVLAAGADVVKGSRYIAGGGSDDISPLRSAGNQGLRFLARVVVRQRWTELCYGLAAFRSDAIAQLDLEKIAGGGSMRSDDVEAMRALLDGPATAPVAAAPTTGRRPKEYGHGFEIETLLFLRAALNGLQVAEVPSFEYPRRNGESNLLTFRDGFRVLEAVRNGRRRSRIQRGLTAPTRRTVTPVGAPASIEAPVRTAVLTP